MDLPLEIARVDIERDDALVTRYALRIPVLRVGEQELDAAGLEDTALQRWFTELQRPLG